MARGATIKLIVHGKDAFSICNALKLMVWLFESCETKFAKNDASSMERRAHHSLAFFVRFVSTPKWVSVCVCLAPLVSFMFTYIGSYISMNNASQFNVVTFTGMYPTSFNCYFRWCCIYSEKNENNVNRIVNTHIQTRHKNQLHKLHGGMAATQMRSVDTIRHRWRHRRQ